MRPGGGHDGLFAVLKGLIVSIIITSILFLISLITRRPSEYSVQFLIFTAFAVTTGAYLCGAALAVLIVFVVRRAVGYEMTPNYYSLAVSLVVVLWSLTDVGIASGLEPSFLSAPKLAVSIAAGMIVCLCKWYSMLSRIRSVSWR